MTNPLNPQTPQNSQPDPPPGPPYDLDALADLHAGVYPEQIAVLIREQIAGDPAAAAMLAALDATVADLANMADLPQVRMPDHVAARVDAALAAEAAARAGSSGPGGVGAGGVGAGGWGDGGVGAGGVGAGGWGDRPPAGPRPPIALHRGGRQPPQTQQPQQAQQSQQAQQAGDHEPGRVIPLSGARSLRRRWATGLGVAAAVAAAATVVIVAVRPFGTTAGTGQAGSQTIVTSVSSSAPTEQGNGDGAPNQTGSPAPSQLGQALVMVPGHLDQAFSQIQGTVAAGKFADAALLSQCLTANAESGKEVLGVRQVVYLGETAYAISIAVDSSTAEILVVAPSCGPRGAQLLDEQQTTR